jgi:Xaa-Pro aminopeptidase
MAELHPISVTVTNQKRFEMVSPTYLRERLLQAREKSWCALRDISQRLKEGMTEFEASEFAKVCLQDYGATGQWHKPQVRFGSGTALTFYDPLRTDYRLQPNDAVYLDLGPVWSDPQTGLDYEGDVGDSFSFGSNPDHEKCAETARQLWKGAAEKWLNEKTTGVELYAWLEAEAKKRGYVLLEKITGHRVGDFPHSKYCKERLNKMVFSPTPELWILELQINHATLPMGAFFEDLLS